MLEKRVSLNRARKWSAYGVRRGCTYDLALFTSYIFFFFFTRDLETRRGIRSRRANEAPLMGLRSNISWRCVFKIESRTMIAPRSYVAYQSGGVYTEASFMKLGVKWRGKKKKRCDFYIRYSERWSIFIALRNRNKMSQYIWYRLRDAGKTLERWNS